MLAADAFGPPVIIQPTASIGGEPFFYINSLTPPTQLGLQGLVLDGLNSAGGVSLIAYSAAGLGMDRVKLMKMSGNPLYADGNSVSINLNLTNITFEDNSQGVYVGLATATSFVWSNVSARVLLVRLCAVGLCNTADALIQPAQSPLNASLAVHSQVASEALHMCLPLFCAADCCVTNAISNRVANTPHDRWQLQGGGLQRGPRAEVRHCRAEHGQQQRRHCQCPGQRCGIVH